MQTVLVVFAGGLLVACNAFDPDLGSRPFRCGDKGQCPDGYACVVSAPGEEYCERGVAGADGGAPAANCNDDAELEPNNAISMATDTAIPLESDEASLVMLAICPETDIDIFKFNIDIANKNVRVDVTHDANRGQLIVDILRSNGTSIRTGAPMEGNPDVVRAEVPNLPQDTYYVQVQAPPGTSNNYGIQIVTSGP